MPVLRPSSRIEVVRELSRMVYHGNNIAISTIEIVIYVWLAGTLGIKEAVLRIEHRACVIRVICRREFEQSQPLQRTQVLCFC